MADTKTPIRVLVTGATGNVAYSLIPNILSGSAFGEDQPIILHLLSRSENGLRGLVMEIQDCVFPLHRGTVAASDLKTAFHDVDVAILLASVSRGQATFRNQLLPQNSKITQLHGEALSTYAKKTVKVLVVTNPCNTMAHVCRMSAPGLKDSCFSSLSLLDYNRAVHQKSVESLMNDFAVFPTGPGVYIDALERKTLVKQHIKDQTVSVERIAAFGNHSPTVVIDLSKVVASGAESEAEQKLNLPDDEAQDLQERVRQRAGDITFKMKQTPVLSTAAAIVAHLRAWWLGTEKGQWIAAGVMSDASYGVPVGLFSTFPVTVCLEKGFSIVKDCPLSETSMKSLQDSVKELQAETQMAEVSLQTNAKTPS